MNTEVWEVFPRAFVGIWKLNFGFPQEHHILLPSHFWPPKLLCFVLSF